MKTRLVAHSGGRAEIPTELCTCQITLSGSCPAAAGIAPLVAQVAAPRRLAAAGPTHCIRQSCAASAVDCRTVCVPGGPVRVAILTVQVCLNLGRMCQKTGMTLSMQVLRCRHRMGLHARARRRGVECRHGGAAEETVATLCSTRGRARWWCPLSLQAKSRTFLCATPRRAGAAIWFAMQPARSSEVGVCAADESADRLPKSQCTPAPGSCLGHRAKHAGVQLRKLAVDAILVGLQNWWRQPA